MLAHPVGILAPFPFPLFVIISELLIYTVKTEAKVKLGRRNEASIMKQKYTLTVM
jgi:hypothetical protein